jgi:hypothetical protein
VSERREKLAWPGAEAYAAAQGGFTPAEEYIISKLASKPTLAAALDSLYRRDPRRWHKVLAAATIARRT